MNVYRITYKRNQTELPSSVKADGYRVNGRFFDFYVIPEDSIAEVFASISSDLVAYVSMESSP